MPRTRSCSITSTDRIRLLRLLSTPVASSPDPTGADELHAMLEESEIVSEGEVPPSLVTMNSRIELRAGSERRLVTLVYPFQADESASLISVLSPAGLALLGRSVGDEVEWHGPDGPRRSVVERIVYQPEASGDTRL